MEQIKIIEALASILFQTFEAQVQTIHLLGPNRMRPTVVHHTKTMIEALVKTLESIETQFIADIEEEAEEALKESASTAKVIMEIKDAMPEMELLQEFSKMAKVGHRSFTSTLSQGEIEMTSEVRARLGKLKKSASTLLTQVTNM